MGLRVFVCGRAPACARPVCVGLRVCYLYRESPLSLSLSLSRSLALPLALSLSLSLCTLSSAELGWASITNLMVGFIAKKIRWNSFGRPIYLTKQITINALCRNTDWHWYCIRLFHMCVCCFLLDNVALCVVLYPLRSIRALWELKRFGGIIFFKLRTLSFL